MSRPNGCGVELLFGHPFLTRLAYYRLMHPGPPDLDALLDDAAEPDGPFGDHLRALLTKLRGYGPEDLLTAMRQVCRHGTIPDDDTFYRLHGAGLVRREGKGSSLPTACTPDSLGA